MDTAHNKLISNQISSSSLLLFILPSIWCAFIKAAGHSGGECRQRKCKLIYITCINCNLTINDKSIKCKVLGMYICSIKLFITTINSVSELKATKSL